MLRTLFTIGVVAIVALYVLKFAGVIVFGVLGPLLGLAIKVLLVGAVVYGVIRLVAPDSARRLRDRFDTRSY
jgi:hypothetical protein